MRILTAIFLSILGLIFGSFWSVIFFRLGDLPSRKTLKGFFIGRSECRNCHHTLHSKDLIPLRSFFSQGGKCRYCKTKLSRRYPILEFWTIFIFLATYVVIGQEEALFLFSSPEFWLLAIGLRLLFIILLYDIKEYELHLTASVLLLLISAIAQRALGYNLRAMLQGMIIFFCVFLAIYYGGKLLVRWKYKKKAEGFGFGDVIIAGILGSIFPVFIAPSGIIEWVYFICSYLIISSVLGIGTFFIKNFSSPKPKEDKQTIPFLPAMIIAFVLFILYGDTLLNFLLSFNW